MSKVYSVSDLFYTSWHQLSVKKHAEVYALLQMLEQAEKGSVRYGALLINILRLLRRKYWVGDRINEEQAVDIFNDLTFLHEPWYYFPAIDNKGLVKPDEKMARHTLDHFIYADNEYSSFLAMRDDKYLRRLLVTLYMATFDKEAVEDLAHRVWLEDHKLTLVFFTYAQIREFVMKRCKTLLPKGPKPKEDETPEPIRPTGSMWLKIKHRLSETPAFQGFDTAGKAGMYDALDYLEGLAQQQAQKTK